MITTTHAILNTALLGDKKHPEHNWPLILGSILPDAPMFLYFFMLIFFKHPLGNSAHEFHFRQLWVDWFHSIPMAAAGFLVCWLLKYGQGFYFFAAMILHDLEDLPLHSVIVHRHFLPFSDYVFHSPISYWEPDHHSAWVAPIEWVVVILCAAILWRRGLKPGTQLLLIFVVIFQAVMLLYTLGFHWWLF